MADVIKERAATAAQWTSSNPILLDRQVGYETDTLKSKIGDGVIAWNSLVYIGSVESLPIATAGGTANAITVTITGGPALVNLTKFMFVASGANTITNPTLAYNGGTARVIYKKGGVALSTNDIPGNLAVCIVEYNLANTRWELVNPAVTDDYFAYEFNCNSLSPADATTYYFGSMGSTIITPTATAADHAHTTPNFAFTIIGAIICAGINTTPGTTELSTLKWRNITDSTVTDIGTFRTDGSTTVLKYTTIDGLSIAVPASKSVAFDWVTPTWVTNPVGCRVTVKLICKR